MHLQPLFADCEYFGGETARDLFERGICLPSSSSLSKDDQEYVIGRVRARNGRRAIASAIREVAVEDLLGRASVNLEHGRISATLRGRTVLVTGAAGSIGSGDVQPDNRAFSDLRRVVTHTTLPNLRSFIWASNWIAIFPPLPSALRSAAFRIRRVCGKFLSAIGLPSCITLPPISTFR